MAKLNEVYKCQVCGNVVEVVEAGMGVLSCCGQDMKIMVSNTVDAAQEKHVPVIERTDDGIVVKIGSVDHPMTEEHYICWIELLAGNDVCRVQLAPNDKPMVCFPPHAGPVVARAYCNLHGLWEASL